jgi:hypothetical protein
LPLFPLSGLMLSLLVRILLFLPLLAPMLGCQTLAKRGKTPLAPASMSPDSVVVEVFRIRFPSANQGVNEAVWDEIDEQHFPTHLRRQLAGNGFRVGLIGGQVPITLSRLMQLRDAPPPTGQSTEVSVAAMEEEPTVQRKQMTLRSGKRGEIVVSGIYEQLPVLINRAGELGGKTYYQAQGMLAIKAFPQRDGRVRIEMVPELHHGKLQQRWTANQGVMRLDAGRPRRVFEEMRVEGMLAPGEMLLIGGLSSRPGSLGHHFFTRDNGHLERQLLVVRLAQTQHQDMFSPVLALDE